MANHLYLLGEVMNMEMTSFSKEQNEVLQNNLLEYLFNENYTFQATALFKAVDLTCS